MIVTHNDSQGCAQRVSFRGSASCDKRRKHRQSPGARLERVPARGLRGLLRLTVSPSDARHLFEAMTVSETAPAGQARGPRERWRPAALTRLREVVNFASFAFAMRHAEPLTILQQLHPGRGERRAEGGWWEGLPRPGACRFGGTTHSAPASGSAAALATRSTGWRALCLATHRRWHRLPCRSWPRCLQYPSVRLNERTRAGDPPHLVAPAGGGLVRRHLASGAAAAPPSRRAPRRRSARGRNPQYTH